MRREIDQTARLNTLVIMKQTTKLSLCLWLLTGLNLTASVTAFLLGGRILKVLNELPTIDKDQATLFQMKTMIEAFGNAFYSFALCLLTFTFAWYILVRQCVKPVPAP